MDYIDGTDAARLLEQKCPAGMPIDIVVPITTAVAGALGSAVRRAGKSGAMAAGRWSSASPARGDVNNMAAFCVAYGGDGWDG